MTTLRTPRRSLSPWQWIYGGAHRIRRAWVRRKTKQLPRPVISIGNLHWGGGGKTPLVAAVATHLRDSGRRVAILSRGYGSQGKGVRVLSRGHGPLLGPRLAGDEPVLLAGSLPGVSVIVCPDRHLAGSHALHRLDEPPEIFLLDDGFSHLALHRDLDLLVFPASDPFAGGRLPPGGRLREPLASAARADAVLLTGAGKGQDLGTQLAEALRPYAFDGPGFASRTRIEKPRLVGDITPEGYYPNGELLPGARAIAVSGIAQPRTFRETLRDFEIEIVHHFDFPDHHPYPKASIDKIRQAYTEHGADLVITTGKDRVKLQGHLEIPVAEVAIRAEPELGFFTWLDQRLVEIERDEVERAKIERD